jgi:hypothetical protein
MGSPRQLELPCCPSTGVRSLGPVQDQGQRLDPSSAGAIHGAPPCAVSLGEFPACARSGRSTETPRP